MESNPPNNLPAKLPPSLPISRTDRNEAVATIAALLTAVVTSINIQFNMNAKQIVDCAEEIYTSRSQITIAELTECLQRGRRSEYGELYNRLDISVIFSWINKYMENRPRKLARTGED